MGTMQATIFSNLSEKEAVPIIGKICHEDMLKSNILASVSAAQFILESGYGKTGLAQEANNCFGMKTDLSNNKWSGSTWDGVSYVTRETKEEYTPGVITTITATFRKYPCIEDSIADHSAYLLGAKNGDKLRYEGLQGEKDYRKAIQIIKDGGYATDSQYVDKICDIIQRWNLTEYDVVEESNAEPTESNLMYCVQVGAYEIKENAYVQLRRVQGAGFDAFVKYVDGYYKVQVGAYLIKENADKQLAKVKDAGFDAFINTMKIV